jgi:hypothetical protein
MKWNESVIRKVEFREEVIPRCELAAPEVYSEFSYLWMSAFLCPIAIPAESLQVGNTSFRSDAAPDTLSMRLDMMREYCVIQ